MTTPGKQMGTVTHGRTHRNGVVVLFFVDSVKTTHQDKESS